MNLSMGSFRTLSPILAALAGILEPGSRARIASRALRITTKSFGDVL
jgi:hypothetical protein